MIRLSIGSAAKRVAIQVLGSGAHVLSVNDMYLKRIASGVEGLEVTPLDLENVGEEVVRENIRENPMVRALSI